MLVPRQDERLMEKTTMGWPRGGNYNRDFHVPLLSGGTGKLVQGVMRKRREPARAVRGWAFRWLLRKENVDAAGRPGGDATAEEVGIFSPDRTA